MFAQHVITPTAFAQRFVELLPEYLPGVDTGAFEPTDRRRCWNKTLKAVLAVIGKEDCGLLTTADRVPVLKDQSSLVWQRDGAPVFAMTTGWGDRNELEMSLESLAAFKCPQKLFVYSCGKWREAVLGQIGEVMSRYPYHMEGEQYLLMNLVGAQNQFELSVADLERNGRQETSVRRVSGSPFIWRTDRRGGSF